MTPEYLATTSRNTLLVSESGKDKPLLEVDYFGKVIHKETAPVVGMEWCPRGICCGKDGEIFVVNAASYNKGAILRFTDTWQYTGCVVRDLCDPLGISMSDDGKILAVIDRYSELKIFRRD